MSASSPRLRPPFRADHIGSLKRPAALLKKRDEFDEGKCTQEELEAVENEAITTIVQMQRKAGNKAITDGKFRRHMFYDGVFDNLEGMEYIPVVPSEWLMDYVPDVEIYTLQLEYKGPASYICKSKPTRTKPFYVGQFEALKKLTLPEEHKNLKITIMMVARAIQFLGFIAHAHIGTEEYFADISQAYKEEIRDLYAAGCRNIQFDDPLLAFFCDTKMLKGMEGRGIYHEALFRLVLPCIPRDFGGPPYRHDDWGAPLSRGLQGSNISVQRDGRHWSEEGYDRIATKLFQDIPVDTYYLEYDTDRAGTFEPLRWLPRNKSVVLGLSSKLPQLEAKDAPIDRVHHAVTTIAEGEVARSKEEALNQICISPQCGFASHSDGNRVSEDDVARKLSLVAETAKAIWADA